MADFDSPLPFTDDETWWHVYRSGLPETDFERGAHYAALALHAAKRQEDAALIACILADIVNGGEMTALEAGFFVAIASAARAGAMN